MHLGRMDAMGQCVVEPVPGPGEPLQVKAGQRTGVATGVASGGIGDLEDGEYLRRIRIVMEGTFWETCEYRWNSGLGKQSIQHDPGWMKCGSASTSFP